MRIRLRCARRRDRLYVLTPSLPALASTASGFSNSYPLNAARRVGNDRYSDLRCRVSAHCRHSVWRPATTKAIPRERRVWTTSAATWRPVISIMVIGIISITNHLRVGPAASTASSTLRLKNAALKKTIGALKRKAVNPASQQQSGDDRQRANREVRAPYPGFRPWAVKRV